MVPPVYLNAPQVPAGEDVSLFSLDVCDAAGRSLSLQSADMPLVSERPSEPVSYGSTALHKIDNPSFIPFLIAFQLERPPRV